MTTTATQLMNRAKLAVFEAQMAKQNAMNELRRAEQLLATAIDAIRMLKRPPPKRRRCRYT